MGDQRRIRHTGASGGPHAPRADQAPPLDFRPARPARWRSSSRSGSRRVITERTEKTARVTSAPSSSSWCCQRLCLGHEMPRVLASPLMGRGGCAQSNAERVVSGYYTPSHDYDLIHQRIEVSNFDWDSTAFDGKVTTTLVSLRPAARFGRDGHGRSSSRSDRVTTAGRQSRCAALAFARPGDSLVVRLGRTPPASATPCGSPSTTTEESHRAAGSTSSRTSPAAPPAAADLQWRRHRRESALDPDLGRSRTTRPPGRWSRRSRSDSPWSRTAGW